eukprot:m.255205 g.255205  ORF g.255205 m.255205 type:complete len:70 (-) comp19158_c0_seq2:99-308(-)
MLRPEHGTSNGHLHPHTAHNTHNSFPVTRLPLTSRPCSRAVDLLLINDLGKKQPTSHTHTSTHKHTRTH